MCIYIMYIFAQLIGTFVAASTFVATHRSTYFCWQYIFAAHESIRCLFY